MNLFIYYLILLGFAFALASGLFIGLTAIKLI
uniref:Cytochrome b6-f complex subunit 6 n=1 Tax=Schizocladia ischiensis TaxID=196139 RepID=A0A7S6U9Y7_9STRA|nr:PetL [Schizocladia ischiensis]QOW07496.1 PetL [Schizocladia ischiensis]